MSTELPPDEASGTSPTESRSDLGLRSRRARIVGVCGVLLTVGAGAWWLTERNSDDEEVCETTVYEGCPQRWDYLTEE